MGTIELLAEPHPWMPLARLMKVSIDIDGALTRLRWGRHAFRVAPGEHRVAVGAGYHFASRAELSVSVGAADTIQLRYTAGLVKHLRGRLVVESLPKMQVRKR